MTKPQPWKTAWRNRLFRIHLVIVVGSLIFIAGFIQFFFQNILQPKPGVLLNDVLLNHLTPKNWSALIFFLIYASVVAAIVSNWKKPFSVLLGIETYAAINLVRICTLYAVTLEAPRDIIPLVDPLMDEIAYGGDAFVKDLFFSGHTASLFLLFLLERGKKLKVALLFSTIAVAILILWQHVHYSVDVLTAPLITYVIFNVFLRVHRASFGTDSEQEGVKAS